METLRVTNAFHKHEEIQIQPSEQLERLKRDDDLLHHQENGPNGGHETGAPSPRRLLSGAGKLHMMTPLNNGFFYFLLIRQQQKQHAWTDGK